MAYKPKSRGSKFSSRLLYTLPTPAPSAAMSWTLNSCAAPDNRLENLIGLLLRWVAFHENDMEMIILIHIANDQNRARDTTPPPPNRFQPPGAAELVAGRR